MNKEWIAQRIILYLTLLFLGTILCLPCRDEMCSGKNFPFDEASGNAVPGYDFLPGNSSGNVSHEVQL